MGDDLTISQSTSILRYLADTHPEIDEKFYPKDPKNRAKVNEFMDFFHLPMNAVSSHLHYFDIKFRLTVMILNFIQKVSSKIADIQNVSGCGLDNLKKYQYFYIP